MATPLQQYSDAIDRLRELRRGGGDIEEGEAAIADEQDAMWESMSDADRTEARGMSWRAWPDQYDAQQKGLDRG